MRLMRDWNGKKKYGGPNERMQSAPTSRKKVFGVGQ